MKFCQSNEIFFCVGNKVSREESCLRISILMIWRRIEYSGSYLRTLYCISADNAPSQIVFRENDPSRKYSSLRGKKEMLIFSIISRYILRRGRVKSRVSPESHCFHGNLISQALRLLCWLTGAGHAIAGDTQKMPLNLCSAGRLRRKDGSTFRLAIM